MQISMIVATDSNGGIGANNSLPWMCREDMIHFRKKTIGKPVIMGRATFESMRCQPLSERFNIVVTTQDGIFRSKHNYDNIVFVNSPKSALQAAQYWYDINRDDAGIEDVMVIGGAAMYEAFLPVVETAYVTTIHKEFHCDTNIRKLLRNIQSQFDMQTVKTYNDVVNCCQVTFERGSRELPADVRELIKLFK